MLGIGFENDIAFACILNMPDETLTMHLLWRTLAINNCSAYVKSFNSSGISPTQRPFASARVGIFFLSRDSAHMGQTLLQPGAKMGPFNSLTGSEVLHLAFLVTPSTFIIFSTFLFIFLIPCLLILSIESYFMWLKYCKKIWTSFTFVIFKQNLCIF